MKRKQVNYRYNWLTDSARALLSQEQRNIRNHAIKLQMSYEAAVKIYLRLHGDVADNYKHELEQRRIEYCAVLDKLREMGVMWGPNY